MKLFSIKDVKAQSFGNVLNHRSTADAIRSLTRALEGDSNLSKFPGDFELWMLGELDELTGEFTNAPSVIGGLTDFMPRKEDTSDGSN